MPHIQLLISLLLSPPVIANKDQHPSFRDCPECPEMVIVPAGSFLMGDHGDWYSRRNERPLHKVTIEKPFAVGRYEVTFSEWDTCVKDGGCHGNSPNDFGFGRGNRPVFNISWNSAQTYIRWLNGKSGQKYRLLTESEWEYMARAGTTSDYTTGDTITPDQANYNGDPHSIEKDATLNRNKTMPVGSYPPNKFGIYDVEGNVMEYTLDCWHDNFGGAPTDGSAWIEDGDCYRRVAKSGAWGDTKDAMRPSSRGWFKTTRTSVSFGFRLAKSLE